MTEIQNVSQLTALIQNPKNKNQRGKKRVSLDLNINEATQGKVVTFSQVSQPATSITLLNEKEKASPFQTTRSLSTTDITPPYPTPRQPFTSAMDLYRSQYGHPSAKAVGTTTTQPSMDAPVQVMRNVGRTQLEKHAIKMRQLAQAMVSNSSATRPPALKRAKIDPATVGFLNNTSSHTNPTWRQKAMERLIGSFQLSSSASAPGEEDQIIMRELDRDVARALVHTGGKALGIHPDELYNSPGLQKLVARNMQWFNQAPDWLKLAGLCAAKKLNGYLQPENCAGVEFLPPSLFIEKPQQQRQEEAASSSSSSVIKVEEKEKEPVVSSSTADDDVATVVNDPPPPIVVSSKKKTTTNTKGGKKRPLTLPSSPSDDVEEELPLLD